MDKTRQDVIIFKEILFFKATYNIQTNNSLKSLPVGCLQKEESVRLPFFLTFCVFLSLAMSLMRDSIVDALVHSTAQISLSWTAIFGKPLDAKVCLHGKDTAYRCRLSESPAFPLPVTVFALFSGMTTCLDSLSCFCIHSCKHTV